MKAASLAVFFRPLAELDIFLCDGLWPVVRSHLPSTAPHNQDEPPALCGGLLGGWHLDIECPDLCYVVCWCCGCPLHWLWRSPISSVKSIRLSNLPVLINLLSVIEMCFATVLMGIIPLSLALLFLILGLSPPYWGLHQQGGKYKAFSTCGSHLSVVCLFYGTGLKKFSPADYPKFQNQRNSLWCTLWSRQCWIHLFTLWGTST